MNDKPRENPLLTAIVCAVIVLACALAVSLRFRMFVNYDTCAMQIILNGDLSGTPDSRVFFMNILTGKFLVFLYKACPAVEWCSAFLLFSFLFSFWALLFRVMTLLKDRPQSVRLACCGCAALIFSFLFLWDLIEISFTGCSVAAGFSLLVYLLSTRRFDFKDWVLVFLLAVLCCGIRPPVMRAVMPYIFLAFLAKWVGKKFRAPDLAILSTLCLVLLASHVATMLAYRDEYKDQKKMNSLRSSIQDYEGLPDYSDEKELYDRLEIDEVAYGVMRLSWGLSEDFNEDVLQTINEYNKSKIEKIPRARKLINRVFFQHYNSSFWIVGGLLLCVAFCVMLRAKKYGSAGYLLLVLATGAGELLYLSYTGRLPRRVSCIVFFGTVAICLGLILREAGDRRLFRTPWRFWLACAAFAALAGFGLHENLSEFGPAEEQNQLWGQMLHYFAEHPENTYCTNCTYNEPLALRGKRGRNYLKISGWLSGTLGWKTALQKDWPTPWDAVAYRDDLRFCMDEENMDVLVYYLNQQGYCSEAELVADPLENEKYLIWRIETDDSQTMEDSPAS